VEVEVMPSTREQFWAHSAYAVVGHNAKRPFPKLSYGGLKASGKKVFAVDPSGGEVEGDPTVPSLAALPESVDAAVFELPKDEVPAWIHAAADAGITRVWLHMKTDSPEAFAAAEERGVELQHGTCAVMYVTPGLSFHSIHKWIMQVSGKF
jgi:predicted CoA-binding protein